MNEESIVRFAAVYKAWEGRTVLNRIDFETRSGQLNVITGPSGSGKTTFCAIAGLIESPDAGELTFLGENTGAKREHDLARLRAQHIGFAFQHHLLLPYLTPRRNMELGGRYCNTPLDREWMIALSKRLGIEHLLHRKIATLSGGEAQRVALARALVMRPRLLIADEPTGNLDEENSATIMHLLREFADDGVAVIVVSHDRTWLKVASHHYTCIDGQLIGGA